MINKIYTDGQRLITVSDDRIPYYKGEKIQLRTPEAMAKPINQQALKTYKAMELASKEEIEKISKGILQVESPNSIKQIPLAKKDSQNKKTTKS